MIVMFSLPYITAYKIVEQYFTKSLFLIYCLQFFFQNCIPENEYFVN